MKSRRALIVVGILCATSLRTSGQITPEDFAYGYEIVIDREAPIYKLLIPADVYRSIVHDDLSDLRVFNGAGEPLPHSIRSRTPLESSDRRSADLPFFPLRGEPPAEGPLSVRVERNDRGTIVQVAEGDPGSESVEAWLIDVSHLDRLPDSLELDWSDAARDFTARVSVHASNDLADWTRLVYAATLARLHFEGNQLEKRSIDLPPTEYEYLRLDWPPGAAGIMVSGVTGWFREEPDPVERAWTELEASQRGHDGTFHYELDVNAPIDRVGLTLPEGNVLFETSIASRDDEGPWRVRADGSFYRVSTEGSAILRDHTSIMPTRDRHWKVRLRDHPPAPPALRLGWAPAEIFFLARGEGPYTLAWGAGDVRSTPTSVEDLLDQVDGVENENYVSSARVSEARDLGGEQRLSRSNLNRRDQVILWSILILGSLSLAFMALNLWRQMNRSDDQGR